MAELSCVSSRSVQRQKEKTTVALEACADQSLWIWHASFGWPGSLNDINILDRSPALDRLMNGEAPAVRFEINGNEYMAYSLADGIYPHWPVSVKTIPHPENKRQAITLRTVTRGLRERRRASMWGSASQVAHYQYSVPIMEPHQHEQDHDSMYHTLQQGCRG